MLLLAAGLGAIALRRCQCLRHGGPRRRRLGLLLEAVPQVAHGLHDGIELGRVNHRECAAVDRLLLTALLLEAGNDARRKVDRRRVLLHRVDDALVVPAVRRNDFLGGHIEIAQQSQIEGDF